MKLHDLKISTQLRFGLGTILLFVGLLSAVSWRQSNQIWEQTEGLYNHPLIVQRALGDAATQITEMQGHLKDLCLVETEQERETLAKGLDAHEVAIHESFAVIYRSYLGPRRDVEEAEKSFAEWKAMRDEIRRLLREGKKQEAISRVRPLGVSTNHVEMILREISDINKFARNRGDLFYREAEGQMHLISRQLIVAGAIVMALALAITLLLLKGIKTPLAELTSAAERLRQGQLDARSRYASANEFGTLSAAFNDMAETLQTEMQIKENAARLAGVMLQEADLAAFCRELLKALIERTGAQVGAVYFLNEAKTAFEHCDSIGLGAKVRPAFSATALEGEFGAALATRQIQRITDIPTDTPFAFTAVSGEFRPREILTIPIVSGQEVVAVISLASVRAFPAPAVRLVHDIWNVLTARVNGVLAFRKIQALAARLEHQNHELDAQKVALEAHASEMAAQSKELAHQNTELEMQKRQLGETSRLKSAFLSNMSHELRTPLNSVLALSRVLQLQGRARLTAEEFSYLEIIERNGKHLLALINDILDLAKIESGRMDLARAGVAMGGIISAVAESLEPLCREKGLALVVDVAADLPNLWSDERRIFQVLQNIMGNAVKFTRAGRITVNARRSGGHLVVTVADTGIGIPEKELPHIFDEFRQVDGGTARSFEGTGLGLAIVAKFMRLLGGHVAVQSTLDVGSTFTLTFPLDTAPTAPGTTDAGVPASADSVPPTADRRTVLVVDDDPADAKLIADFLAAEGYLTLTALSGQAALQLAETHHPFAITLDIIMPDLDGWEVLQALKRNPATAPIPVIIISLSDDRETGLALGAVGIVAKPVDRSALLAEVRRVAPPGRASILIVDDAEFDRRTVAEILEAEGLDVRQASNGPQSLALMQERIPDALVLDLMMPGMSGFEVLDELRRNAQTRQLPVIVVTAQSLSAEDRSRLQGRVAAVMEKSRLNSGDLLTQLAQILARIEKSPPRPLRPPATAGGRRLLLVEDSEPAIIQMRMVLEAAGYELAVARGGQEAMNLMGDPPPDGIILDLMMPGIDGFAVLERLRGSPATAHTPVLILTAKDLTREDLGRLSANNVRQLIQKGDVDRQELLRQIERMLGRPANVPAPAASPTATTPPAVRNRPPANRLPVILTIEDNPDNQATLRAILKSRCVLQEASDGEEGLRRAIEQRPDLILLDLSLPKMDGAAVAQGLRANPATCAIPVIALTAHAMPGDREKALLAGCDDYLAKPIDVDLLLSLLGRWLSPAENQPR